MLKKPTSIHGPWRVKRETCEKGAPWADWIPTSFGPSRLSRAAILQEYSPLVPDVGTIEILACQNCFSDAC